jgi:hypothetical protein
VRIQGASSRIIVAGESTAVFHRPVTNSGSTIEVFAGSTAIYSEGLTTTGAAAELSVHLSDPDEEPGFAKVEVGAAAQVDGTLEINLAGGFMPTVGDAFEILSAISLTGQFADVTGDYLGEGLFLDPNYANNGLMLVTTQAGVGDTDLDGDVDLVDLSALAASYGGNNGSIDWIHGDFDHDDDVDLVDLSSLAGNYGAGSAQAHADFRELVAVPEPLSLGFLLGGIILHSATRRARL